MTAISETSSTMQESSSLPLLVAISGAIFAVAVGGWFLLNRDIPMPVDTSVDAFTAPPPEQMRALPEDGVAEVTTVGTADNTPVAAQPAVSDADAELRKARLAADADILVFPEEQSAFHYYHRVLELEPQNAVAVAELDVVLARVFETVAQHLEQDELERAYEIAVLVAKQQPEHRLVTETQRILDERTEQLVNEAIQSANNGDDDRAIVLLAEVESLPGRNPVYLEAVRSSIAEIQSVRQAAEQNRIARAQLAENEARAAWVERIEDAIEKRNLISPAGASARDLLAENNAWTAERQQLQEKLFTAMLDQSETMLADSRLKDVEGMLNAASDIRSDSDELSLLRTALEDAMVDAESRRIANMKELVRVRNVQPDYPRRAAERSQSGWVDVIFTVTPGGETTNIEVSQAEPESVFDKAAVSAVEQWTFEPVEYRGRIISQRAAARLVFRLE